MTPAPPCITMAHLPAGAWVTSGAGCCAAAKGTAQRQSVSKIWFRDIWFRMMIPRANESSATWALN